MLSPELKRILDENNIEPAKTDAKNMIDEFFGYLDDIFKDRKI